MLSKIHKEYHLRTCQYDTKSNAKFKREKNNRGKGYDIMKAKRHPNPCTYEIGCTKYYYLLFNEFIAPCHYGWEHLQVVSGPACAASLQT